jgi:hypothetical protein
LFSKYRHYCIFIWSWLYRKIEIAWVTKDYLVPYND